MINSLVKSRAFLWTSFLIFFACYLGNVLWAAKATPLWLDEVLSAWAIRLGSAREIWLALLRGSEFAPPTFNLLLHYYSQLFGGSNLILRLPSIAGIAAFAACGFVIFRRYLSLAAALFGCFIILEAMRTYALQLRPYGLCAACFGLALVFWDDVNQGRQRFRVVGICLLLALATSIHFYSVLFIPCMGIAELLRYLRTRQLRISIWLAFFVAGLLTFAWLPLIRVLSKYNSGDTSSPGYYAHPSTSKLISSYWLLLTESHVIPIVFLAIASFSALLWWLEVPVDFEKQHTNESNLWALAFGVSALPIVVFSFSLLVTHTYNERYVIATALGLAALLAGLFSRLPTLAAVLPPALLVAAFMAAGQGLSMWGDFEREPVYRMMEGTSPIVVSDVQQFFTLEEASPANIHSRLVYLQLPPEAPHSDPTVINQLGRWLTINPKLPVQPVELFLKTHKDFLMLDTHSGEDDAPTNYLLDRHAVELVHRFSDGTLLFKSRQD